MRRANVTVTIDAELREQAREYNIPLSRTLDQAIRDKIADIERWLTVQHGTRKP